MPRISMSQKLNDSSKLQAVDTTGYKEIYLDAEFIVPAEENFYPLDEIEELADDMLERGQLQPLLIGRVDGEYKLAVGHRRRAAILLNNHRGHVEKAWCFAKEMDQIEFMLTLISANAYTRRMDDATLLEQAEKLKYWTQKAVDAGKLEISGRKRDFLADKLQISPTKMAQVNQINSHLSDEGKQALKDGKINFSKAYETSRLPEEEQSEVIHDEHLLSTDVRAMVHERKEPKVSFSDVVEESTEEQEETSESISMNIHIETEKDSDVPDSEETKDEFDILDEEIQKYRSYLKMENGPEKRRKKYEILLAAVEHYRKYLFEQAEIRMHKWLEDGRK